MNETIKTIFNRRSTRAFSEKAISREDLELIVQAGYHAPSGRNMQKWKFTVVQNKDLMAEIATVLGRTLSRDGYDLYKPNALILVSSEEDHPHGVSDCSCALENIFLAAESLGIASVWLNQFKGVCNEPEVRALLDKLNMPKNHVVIGVAALGYSADASKKADKRTDVVEWFV